MSNRHQVFGFFALILQSIFFQVVAGQDFNDPQTLALTIGCVVGAVVVILLIATLCAFCLIREDGERSENGRSFDYDPGFHTDSNQPPGQNNPNLQNGGTLSNSETNNMAVPPGVWTTNPSMYTGPPPPGHFMTNGSYGSNPRTQHPGTWYPPQGPMPRPQDYSYRQHPGQPQPQRPKQNWYQRTIGRAQKAFKNFPSVFQVKESGKKTLSYKQALKQQEELQKRERQKAQRHHQNGGIASDDYSHPRSEVTRSSSGARGLPRDGASPPVSGRRGESPRSRSPTSHQRSVDQADVVPQAQTLQYGNEREADRHDRHDVQAADSQIPVIAKAFSDYREPADVLPAERGEHIARAFSSYQSGINAAGERDSRFVARAFSRTFSQESEHKYALPQDAIPLTQSDYRLDANHRRVSKTRSDGPRLGKNPVMASKFSNYPGGYVPGSGGSAGPLIGSRIPSHKGVLMRSPSDVQRLSNYKSLSLERTAAQYHNMPQQSRSRADVIREEKQKSAKNAKQKSKQKGKEKPQKGSDVIGIMKNSAPRERTQPGQESASRERAQPGQGSAHVGRQAVQGSSQVDRHYRTVPGPQPSSKPAVTQQSPPSSPDEDPFALYARPSKVRNGASQPADKRPISIDVPTDNPAPFVVTDTPISPDPPPMPPHPDQAAAKTPQNRTRNKSESASAEFALEGDDVTSSAFKFLEDFDADADASYHTKDGER